MVLDDLFFFLAAPGSLKFATARDLQRRVSSTRSSVPPLIKRQLHSCDADDVWGPLRINRCASVSHRKRYPALLLYRVRLCPSPYTTMCYCFVTFPLNLVMGEASSATVRHACAGDLLRDPIGRSFVSDMSTVLHHESHPSSDRYYSRTTVHLVMQAQGKHMSREFVGHYSDRCFGCLQFATTRKRSTVRRSVPSARVCQRRQNKKSSEEM